MRILLLSLSTSIFLCSQFAAANEKTYTFGIVPQQSSTILAKRWGPILQEVSKRSGYKLVFRTAPNIPTFEKRVRSGDYDLAYMNPVHYTIFAKSVGYRAFAKQKGKRIKGIIVVHKNSPIKSLGDLNDATIAFPAPAAFAASILPRGSLFGQNIPFMPKYVGSHGSVYRGVARNFFVAGGGIQRTLGTVAANVRENLRVLWTSKGYTPHAFAAHPHLSGSVITSIQNAFISMINDPESQNMLVNIGFKQGIESASNEDWDDVRALDFNELPQ